MSGWELRLPKTDRYYWLQTIEFVRNEPRRVVDDPCF